MKKQIMAGAVAGMMIISTTVFAASADKQITVTPNQMKVVVNGANVTADNFVYNGTTYLPLRAVSEALGAQVGYDASTQTATITGSSATDSSAVKELKMDAVATDVYYQLMIQSAKLYNEISNLVSYCSGYTGIDKSLDTWEARIETIKTEVKKQNDRVSKYEAADSSYQATFADVTAIFSNFDQAFSLMPQLESDCKYCKVDGSQSEVNQANKELKQMDDLCNKITSDCQTQHDKYTSRMTGE